MLDLAISSPKRNRRLQNGWEGFFPYYAGYPESFVKGIIESARLPQRSIVLDPWNGSGTTTYTAGQLGHIAVGLDLNPVMVAVARARMLPFSEADALEPLSKEIAKGSREETQFDSSDPLVGWFDNSTALVVRSIERSICKRLIGSLTLAASGTNLDRLSGIAATFYISLFSVCRELATTFRSTNPTWMRRAKHDDQSIFAHREWIETRFITNIGAMARALADHKSSGPFEKIPSDIRLADSTTFEYAANSVDLVLTSPPYCTRIDYTAATRIELAVMAPLICFDTVDLGRRMMGSTRVPSAEIKVDDSWGKTCADFLERVRSHPSKASGGYYFRTHVDYFDKLARSLSAISRVLKTKAAAILVVQDSFYKEIHNDLPTIVSEVAKFRGFELKRRDDFLVRRSMAGINRNAKIYKRALGAVESVLCFEKERQA